MGLFNKLNKGRFNFDVTDIKGNYITPKDLYERDGVEEIYVVRAVYLGKMDKDLRKDDLRGKEDKETACVATDEFYVNVPDHQIKEIKEILDSQEMIDAINDGLCGFELVPYEARGEQFVKLRWVDLEADE